MIRCKRAHTAASAAPAHRRPIAALAGALISVAMILATLAGTPVRAAMAGDSAMRTPVWIDTDAACGHGDTHDVDDCWALLQAFRSPEIVVCGISTVFGNVDGGIAFAIADGLTRRFGGASNGTGTAPPVYQGATEGGHRRPPATTEATRAMAHAVRHKRLTLIALGPLTNIAALVKEFPDLAPNIVRIIAVAGKRPGQRFLVGDSGLNHLHDFNLRKDPGAADIVLSSGVPLALLPFEAAQKVTIKPGDLARLALAGEAARWVARTSKGWMGFWRRWLGAEGFHPFDSLAVGYVAMPGLFACETIPARVTNKKYPFMTEYGYALKVSRAFTGAPMVTYCFDVDPRFKDILIDRLAQPLLGDQS